MVMTVCFSTYFFYHPRHTVRQMTSRLLPITAILFILTCFGLTTDCQAQANDCKGGCGSPFGPYEAPPNPRLYVRTEALLLKRDVHDRPAFVYDNYKEYVTTSRLDEPFKGAPKLTVGVGLWDLPIFVEGSYFTLNNWDESYSSYDSTGGIQSVYSGFSGTPSTVYNNLTFAQMTDKAQLQSGELNVKFLIPMEGSALTPYFLLGMRYIGEEENFGFNYTRLATPGTLNALSARTTNDLVGPQIGGILDFYIAPNCWVDLTAKGALCNNHATMTRSVNGTESARVEADGASFVGEVDLQLYWKWTEHMAARIGYQAMWVTDLAVASDNLAISSSELNSANPMIHNSGQEVYHGPHIGLEFYW